MIEKVVDRIVQRLIEEQLLEQGKRAFYVYALQLKCERCFTVGTILLISVILKNELQTILFLLCFLNLRKHTGGYHANTFWQCYLETIITYLLVPIFVSVIDRIFVLHMILLLVASVYIAVVATINHPNMAFDKEEYEASRKMARAVLALEGVSIVLCYAIGVGECYICFMSTAIILCALLMFLAKIHQPKRPKFDE